MQQPTFSQMQEINRKRHQPKPKEDKKSSNTESQDSKSDKSSSKPHVDTK